MVDKSKTQKRILNMVEVYKLAFPEEYKQVCEAIIMSRKLLKEETGAVSGEHSAPSAQRVLHELPEKLYMAFVQGLDGEELDYFKSKEGARWFTKNCPQFALVKI